MKDKDVQTLIQEIRLLRMDLSMLSSEVSVIKDDLAAMRKVVQPILIDMTEKAVNKAMQALDEETGILTRDVKEVAVECGLSQRAISVLTRHGINRMGDFLFTDKKKIQYLRGAGKTTTAEIFAFASGHGIEIPEIYEEKQHILPEDKIITLSDRYNIPRGNMLTVEDIQEPGAENAVTIYTCSGVFSRKREWSKYSPSEIRKVKI